MERSTSVGVYYFPQYHPDPRNDVWHGRGWTEWDLVRRAEPRFPGHRQPKVPAWGYYDEADPTAAARTISAAAEHGIDFFIFDWYYYEDGPFLEACLDNGFLGAANAGDFRFALMWANHPWRNIFPAKRFQEQSLLLPGAMSPAGFVRATDHVIGRYMSLPNYYRIADRAYFSFFDVATLTEGLGGIDRAAVELAGFRDRARAAGAGELHLNGVLWGLPGTDDSSDRPEQVSASPKVVEWLGFDSVTSYNWMQYAQMPELATDYGPYSQVAAAGWKRFVDSYPVPYFPNVSMGWDSSPRTVQSDEFAPLGYPYTPVLVGNTPELFGRALRWCREFVHSGVTEPVFTINAWNEWTEGSYLEPDESTGMAYLEAIATALR
jgi:Glycosyltransferase WbsX